MLRRLLGASHVNLQKAASVAAVVGSSISNGGSSAASIIISSGKMPFSTSRGLLSTPPRSPVTSSPSASASNSTTAGAASPSSSSVINNNFCALCDEPFTNYIEHCKKLSHQARHSICKAYVVPERHEAIMSQLWDHIQLDFALVDQVNNKKIDRRRMKLSGTIGYLVEQGVLMDSVPTIVSTPPSAVAEEGAKGEAGTATASSASFYDVSQRFPILVSMGESYLTYEATQRVSRLMPKALADDVRVISEFLTHPRQIRALFELLQMNSVVENGGAGSLNSSTASTNASSSSSDNAAPPPPKLSPDEKVAVMLAILGEMRIYASKDRKHTVTDKVVADELVLNVLSNHCCENFVSELVHTTLQRIVDEGTPVWNEHRSSIQGHLFSTATNVSRPLESLSLAEMPVEKALTQAQTSALFSAITSDDVGKLFVSSASADATSSSSSASPFLSSTAFPASKANWFDVFRTSTYELQPIGATTKTAHMAQVLPKIMARTRV